jgi:hypothetical protein
MAAIAHVTTFFVTLKKNEKKNKREKIFKSQGEFNVELALRGLASIRGVVHVWLFVVFVVACIAPPTCPRRRDLPRMHFFFFFFFFFSMNFSLRIFVHRNHLCTMRRCVIIAR